MPPRNSAVGVKDVFIWSLLLPVIGALQRQPVYPSNIQSDELSDHAATAAYRWQAPAGDSLNTAVSGHQKFRDTHTENARQHTRLNSNERALATLSPAEKFPAVRAPPAQRSSSNAGLTSRQQARSLRDWQVEDIILLATVDGKIHARDRKTGAEKWQLETDRPMVETVYHAHNKSVDENGIEHEDPLWIVEPTQDGSLYLYAPNSGFGIQKLGFTVKQLVDRSPLASEGHPAVAYSAEKKSTLYTVDAATGNILKTFSSTPSQRNDAQSCRKVNPLATLEEEECERIGTLTLGRTEYTIAVQDRDTSEPISTIKYSEWVPNNNDDDLRIQHSAAKDNKYVYTKHDGTIFGLDIAADNGRMTPSTNKPVYWQKMRSPVARVFDVVRREGDLSEDASLVVLPQPVGPSPDPPQDSSDDLYERIFVNCTSDGSWYALSEGNYPTVTDGAEAANWNGISGFTSTFSTWPLLSNKQQKEFAGVHELSNAYQTESTGMHMIDAPNLPGVEAPVDDRRNRLIDAPPTLLDSFASLRNILTLIALGIMACIVLYQQQTRSPKKLLTTPAAPEPSESQVPPAIAAAAGTEKLAMVRKDEPAQETIFPHDVGLTTEPVEAAKTAEDDFEKIEFNEVEEIEEAKEFDGPKTRKKATRGKRGGKKQKEKEQQQAEARAKRANSQSQQATEIITVAASESTQVSGPLQINSLLVHTDKVIGQGSCGTSVFEGSFEDRAVAVKRMLSQYYELASQEVSFLQQSDDHPNVIRYFCQQRDDHFLYIAVELCQASLFEVWEAEKAKTEERQTQLRALKLTIQQDVPRALQQLAAGLYHLHNLRIIHRDIKPQNILVAFPKRNQVGGPRLVISDFGLGKNLPENVSTLIDPTGNAGTSGWKAPELISQPRDSESRHSQSTSHTGGSEVANGVTSGVKRAADIFSLGCLFFWVLTDGIHPYEDENGWQQLRELNIKRDNKKMEVLERWSDAYEPMQLITSMLQHQPERRPTAIQVLNHPFFWPAEKRLFFLCDMSDHFERESRGVFDDDYRGDSRDLQLLESRAEEVVGSPFERADFLAKLDRHFVDTLGKQRKYSGNRLLDLLRAFRNKKHHYEDMPEDVKKRVGSLPEGYLNYWCNRFPRLLMACYEVVHEAGLQHNDRFKGYFTVGRT